MEKPRPQPRSRPTTHGSLRQPPVPWDEATPLELPTPLLGHAPAPPLPLSLEDTPLDTPTLCRARAHPEQLRLRVPARSSSGVWDVFQDLNQYRKRGGTCCPGQPWWAEQPGKTMAEWGLEGGGKQNRSNWARRKAWLLFGGKKWGASS